MARGFIATVGTGTRPDADITQPLTFSVQGSNPEMAVFLVTAQSEPHALEVVRRTGLPAVRWRVVRLEHMDDLNHVFHVAVEEIGRLMADGFAAGQIEVDYTTGTKSMSAGLALAAVATRCGSLKYVTGRREHGIVIPGTETVHSMRPGEVTAFLELGRVHSLLRDLRFDAALDVWRGVEPRLLDAARAEELRGLEKVIRGYERWDRFDHIAAVELFSQVEFGERWDADYRLPREMLERLRKLGSVRKYGSITEDLVADLANNAWRRWREGRYDDAVARLYRLMEALAQRELRERHGIRAADVKLEQVPQDLHAKLEGYRSERDGRIRIGLAACYWLLGELELRSAPRGEVAEGGDAWQGGLGAAFAGSDRLPKLLEARNGSILAHGLSPVGKDECENLFVEAMALGRLSVPDLDARRHDLQFPWLRGRPDPIPVEEGSSGE